jgi:hypothetical protein
MVDAHHQSGVDAANVEEIRHEFWSRFSGGKNINHME